MKLRRVCAKSCQPSRARFLCGHCGENLSSSQFARHKGLNFKESFTWSGDRVSCNSFSVQDPFGSHCSSEDESIDKGIAEDEGEMELEESDQKKSVMKWTEEKDVMLLTAMAGEGVFQWKHGSREREGVHGM